MEQAPLSLTPNFSWVIVGLRALQPLQRFPRTRTTEVQPTETAEAVGVAFARPTPN